MRVLSRVLIALLLAGIALAQDSIGRPAKNVHVRNLFLHSSTLPDADRDAVSLQIANHTLAVAELEDLIRMGLQQRGYYKATVQFPMLLPIEHLESLQVADVRASVEEGVQYRLRDISFTNGSAFPAEQMRSMFPIQAGEVFDVRKIAKGLEELRGLYAAAGYVNMTAVPDVKFDVAHRVLDLVIDCDEGEIFRFGNLILDGPEPHAGDGKALLKSYERLRGTPYNPASLEKWFADNKAHLPRKVSFENVAQLSALPQAHVMTVRLRFP